MLASCLGISCEVFSVSCSILNKIEETVCLENPMNGGAWHAAVQGVTNSWTRLSG